MHSAEFTKAPQPGPIVECFYRYVSSIQGPSTNRFYLNVRDGIPADECTMDRLKFKAEETAV